MTRSFKKPNYRSAKGRIDAPYAWTPAQQAAFQQAQTGVFDTVGNVGYAGAIPVSNALVPANVGGLVPTGDGTVHTESFWKQFPEVDLNGSQKRTGLGGLFDSFKGGAADLTGTVMDTGKQGWANIKAGKGVLPKYAGLAKGAMGAMAGLKAVQGISDYQNAQRDTEDLVNDILASAAGNDNYRYDLSADQLNTLRQLQNGTFDTSGDFDMGSVLGNLGNIATGAGLGFVTGGGPVGALLGAAGGVVDGVSSGMLDSQNQITADLQGLYQALYESEMRNKQMKRDAAMQRYANSLYA